MVKRKVRNFFYLKQHMTLKNVFFISKFDEKQVSVVGATVKNIYRVNIGTLHNIKIFGNKQKRHKCKLC